MWKDLYVVYFRGCSNHDHDWISRGKSLKLYSKNTETTKGGLKKKLKYAKKKLKI